MFGFGFGNRGTQIHSQPCNPLWTDSVRRMRSHKSSEPPPSCCSIGFNPPGCALPPTFVAVPLRWQWPLRGRACRIIRCLRGLSYSMFRLWLAVIPYSCMPPPLAAATGNPPAGNSRSRAAGSPSARLAAGLGVSACGSSLHCRPFLRKRRKNGLPGTARQQIDGCVGVPPPTPP